MINIVLIGDIFGKEGKEFVAKKIYFIKKKYNPDVIIANGENVSFGGKSMIKEDYIFLKNSGINYFTMGNHTFRNLKINEYIDETNDLVRPANYIENVKGKGFLTFELKGKKVLLFNLLGETFMNIKVKNPFKKADEILSKNKYDIAILDFHAETTSEKIVLGNYLSNRINIFVGTHTHIQTSDERILNNKMAYITDLGMCGVFDSAIGMDFHAVTNRLIHQGKGERFIEARGGKKVLCGLFVQLDSFNLKVNKIERIQIRE
ncbi:MAG: metallophosphoesterase [Candidatus Hepatoplasma vulgare]|nr:MAG: metallophosphoesterase [Candidatus Hepatoplasma sp.]